MPKKDEYIKFKNFGRKLFMIYTDFESILVPEDNRNQNPNKSLTNKYQKHVACNYGYKLAYFDDKFSKPFKSDLGKDAVCKFFSSMTKENKYCSDVQQRTCND